jgi:hypothetical protein
MVANFQRCFLLASMKSASLQWFLASISFFSAFVSLAERKACVFFNKNPALIISGCVPVGLYPLVPFLAKWSAIFSDEAWTTKVRSLAHHPL